MPSHEGSGAASAALDAVYLKLNTTNDPLTGGLDIDVEDANAFRVNRSTGGQTIFSVDTTTADPEVRMDECEVRINTTRTDHPSAQFELCQVIMQADTTANDSSVYTSGAFISRYIGTDTLTSSTGVQGFFMQGEATGSGGTTGVKALQSTIFNSGGANITQGQGINFAHFKAGGGTFPTYKAITFTDLGVQADDTYAFDFQGSYIENNFSVPCLDNTTTEVWMPLSTANTGITWDSQDLTLATTTSGDINVSSAGQSFVDGFNPLLSALAFS